MKYTLLIIFLFWRLLMNGQLPPYHHYDTDNGLVNNTVYNLYEARNGLMWFCTEGGVSKFDSHSFVNFTVADGLNSNTITAILEMDSGFVFLNYAKEPNLFIHDKITSHSANKLKGNFNSAFQSNKTFHISNNFQMFMLNEKEFYEGSFPTYPLEIGTNGKKFKTSRDADKVYMTSNNKLYQIQDKEFTEITLPKTLPSNFICATIKESGIISVADSLGITMSKSGEILRISFTEAFNDIKLLCIDNLERTWMIADNKVFMTYQNRLINVSKALDIENVIANSLYSDRNGNIWMTTSGKGVYFFYNLYCTNLKGSEKFVNNSINDIAVTSAGDAFIGTRKGIDYITSDYDIHNIMKNAFVYELKLTLDKLFCCSDKETKEQEHKQGFQICLLHSSSALVEDEKQILTGRSNRIMRINDGITNSSFSYLNNDSTSITDRIDELVRSYDGNILIGSRKGLYEYNEQTNNISKIIDEEKVLDSHIHDIVVDYSKNRYWVASDYGVALYNNNNFIVKRKFDNYISSFSAFSLAYDGDNLLFIGTNSGLIITDTSFNVKRFLNKHNGLVSNSVLSLNFDKTHSKLWIGTEDGLSILETNSLQTTNIPAPILSCSGALIDSGLVSLQYLRQNEIAGEFIQLLFSAISFTESASITYEYWLDEASHVFASNGNINFSNLEPGNHHLRVKTKSSNSNWSDVYEISFVIATPIFRTLWFKLLVSLLVVLSIILFVKFRVRKYRDQLKAIEKTRQEMISLRQMALSASVNPHFIFNTLNAIQYLVNDNQPGKANDYIARFAIMMRGVLQSSDSNFIPLETELNRLENYLQLEKLRVGNKLDWKIAVEAPIAQSQLEIPQMIIQPFVENSIWHGISNIEGHGFIRIHVSFSPAKNCIITITDNGIGLVQLAKKNPTQHQSKGIQLIKERLSLLNDDDSMDSVQIANRIDGQPGVVVTITLTDNAYRSIKP